MDNNYFPFIHEKKKKEADFEPLYVELYPPPPPDKSIKKSEDEDDRGFIIIEII